MRKSLVLALAVLCAAVPAWTTKKKTEVDAKRFQEKLTKDQQVLHALDRLTFGPRPGDVEIVKKMGVKKWIDLQLHPEKIAENPALEAKLAPLETLRLTQGETEASYPTPQMIRQVAQGRQPLPDDPIARAAVEKQVRRLKVKKDAKDNDPVQPAVPLQSLLTQAQIRALRNGKPEEKKEVLASIPAGQMDDVIIAMPPQLRNQLMAVAPESLRRKFMLSNAPQQVIAYDLSEGKLYRAILSNRQLQEQLVDFWYNHFNVFLDKGNDRFMVPSYEREAIRPHVLGHFRELLEATATAPAMLFYLDNWQSVAPDVVRRAAGKKPTRGLNENYGRELMELHTLGVDGGYTQKDVTEVARCFTGWTIRNPQGGSTYTYNDRVHDKGEKTVLGVKIPAGGGREDGEKVLDILAKHPSTARFISKKLAQRFVADDPPQDADRRHGENVSIHRWRYSRRPEHHVHVEGIHVAGRLSSEGEDAFRNDRQRGARHRRPSRLRVSAGQPHRAARPASVSQAGADRLFQRQRRVDQLRVAAGADEFRAGPDAEQGAGHQGGPVALQRRSRRIPRA